MASFVAGEVGTTAVGMIVGARNEGLLDGAIVGRATSLLVGIALEDVFGANVGEIVGKAARPLDGVLLGDFTGATVPLVAQATAEG